MDNSEKLFGNQPYPRLAPYFQYTQVFILVSSNEQGNAVNSTYWSYWGKADPAYQGGATWHPLVYHSLDVAACGQILLDEHPKWLATLLHWIRKGHTPSPRERSVMNASLYDSDYAA